MNVYYYDMGRKYRLPKIGACSQLRIMNAFIKKAENLNLFFYPKFTIDDHDVYADFFKRKRIDEKIINYIKCPNETIFFEHLDLNETSFYFKDNIAFNDEFSERCEKIYESIGSPTIAINIRETDKAEESFVALPTCFYEDIIKNTTENVFVTSDCCYSIDILKKYENVKTLDTDRSSNFLPLHRMHHLKMNKNRNICEYKQMTDLFTEVYILSKMKKLYFPMLNGVVTVADLINRKIENGISISNIQLINMPTTITDSRTIQILKYYTTREKFLWNLIEEELNKELDY